jgi:hypothetical protein
MFNMKKMILGVFAGVALIVAAGCVNTVDNTHAFAMSWNTDTVTGRYARSLDEVYNASIVVIQHNGVLLNELIPHDTTNSVRSLEGRQRQEGLDTG